MSAPLTPPQLALFQVRHDGIDGRATEFMHQQWLFDWARYRVREHPELRWLAASLNGVKLSPAAAGKAKASGLKAGVADLCLPYPRHGYHHLYIELKAKKGTLTPEQAQFGRDMMQAGSLFVACWGWHAAAVVLRAYLALDRGVELNRLLLTRVANVGRGVMP